MRANLKQCLDVSIDRGVESGKCIIAEDIRIAILHDIVFVVLLANGINFGQNVDDTLIDGDFRIKHNNQSLTVEAKFNPIVSVRVELRRDFKGEGKRSYIAVSRCKLKKFSETITIGDYNEKRTKKKENGEGFLTRRKEDRQLKLTMLLRLPLS